MKKLLLLCVAATLISSLSFATIRRVGYPGTFRANVDYATITQANDAASAGDTIQIYGDAGSGGITKQLVIIGFGYNFDANTGLQAVGTDAPSSLALTCYEGSSGSVVKGITGSFSISALDPNTGTGTTGLSGITFERCFGQVSLSNYVDYGPISNIKIIGCVLNYLQPSYSGATSKPITNLLIYNCIITGLNLLTDNATITATIQNCVVPPSAGLSFGSANVLVKNCIFGYSNYSGNTNTVYENNFFTEANPGAVPGNNNRWGQDYANLFTRNGRSDDAASNYGTAEFDEDYWVLKAGSPAINGGFNAANQPTNCGIYGGEAAYVYKLSGVPPVPAIYKLTAPSLNASANPYNVTISVRSNN